MDDTQWHPCPSNGTKNLGSVAISGDRFPTLWRGSLYWTANGERTAETWWCSKASRALPSWSQKTWVTLRCWFFLVAKKRSFVGFFFLVKWLVLLHCAFWVWCYGSIFFAWTFYFGWSVSYWFTWLFFSPIFSFQNWRTAWVKDVVLTYRLIGGFQWGKLVQ